VRQGSRAGAVEWRFEVIAMRPSPVSVRTTFLRTLRLGPVLLALAALASPVAAGAAARGVSPPSVDLAALRGHGELAIVRDGDLYLAGGAERGVRAVAGPGAASYPQWSPDGVWLAYTRTSSSDAPALWVVRSNGTDNHRVPIGRPGALYVAATAGGPVWSHGGDLLATSAMTLRGQAAGLWVASAGGTGVAVRTAAGRRETVRVPVDLVANGAQPLWSPTGATLAYVVTEATANPANRSDALYTRALTGRAVRHALARGNGILTGSWWPDGHGLVYWIDPMHSASLAADGVKLETIDLRTDKTAYLATTLPYRNWIAWGPGDRVAIVAGGPRLDWTGKSVLQCLAAIPARAVQACVTVSRPGGPITLDPAWSKGGFAYVSAKDLGAKDWGLGPARFAAWQRSRTLWLARPGRAAVRLAAAGTGVVQPVWSAGGRHLLIVRGTSAYLVAPASGATVRIASGIEPDLYPMGYYGYTDESQVLAWSDAG